jgi:hypothetical protein
MNERWRERLRQAVRNRAAITWTKESMVARDAGVAPETLSRVLKARHVRPSYDTVLRIAHAAQENVGASSTNAFSTYDEATLIAALRDAREVVEQTGRPTRAASEH